jgi:hypothetical protein
MHLVFFLKLDVTSYHFRQALIGVVLSTLAPLAGRFILCGWIPSVVGCGRAAAVQRSDGRGFQVYWPREARKHTSRGVGPSAIRSWLQIVA